MLSLALRFVIYVSRVSCLSAPKGRVVPASRATGPVLAGLTHHCVAGNALHHLLEQSTLGCSSSAAGCERISRCALQPPSLRRRPSKIRKSVSGANFA